MLTDLRGPRISSTRAAGIIAVQFRESHPCPTAAGRWLEAVPEVWKWNPVLQIDLARLRCA